MGFEAHAIVELMGHSQIAGLVREEAVFGTALLRVDVPEVGEQKAFTKYFNSSAVYSIIPTDEATAKYAASQFRSKPIQPWVLPLPESPLLAEKIQAHEEPEEEELDFEGESDIAYSPKINGEMPSTFA